MSDTPCQPGTFSSSATVEAPLNAEARIQARGLRVGRTHWNPRATERKVSPAPLLWHPTKNLSLAVSCLGLRLLEARLDAYEAMINCGAPRETVDAGHVRLCSLSSASIATPAPGRVRMGREAVYGCASPKPPKKRCSAILSISTTRCLGFLIGPRREKNSRPPTEARTPPALCVLGAYALAEVERDRILSARGNRRAEPTESLLPLCCAGRSSCGRWSA